MKFKKTNSMNLYLVLVLVSLFLLVVLLFDQCIGLVNRKLEYRVQVEGFESPSSSHKTSKNKVYSSQNISPVSSPESSDISPTSKFEYDEDVELDEDNEDNDDDDNDNDDEVEDISFMHEVENKDLYIL